MYPFSPLEDRVISVLSNVAPKYVHDMVMKYLEGNVKESAKMQLDAIPLCNALFCEVNPIPVKAALNMMGKNVGSLRAPLTEMEDAHKETPSPGDERFRGCCKISTAFSEIIYDSAGR